MYNGISIIDDKQKAIKNDYTDVELNIGLCVQSCLQHILV